MASVQRIINFPIIFSFYVVFQAVGVYFNFNSLMPKYLETRRYTKYALLVLATVLITAACIVSGYYVSALASDKSFRELFGIEPANYMYLFEFSALPLTVGSMTLAIILKVAKNRIQSQWNEQQLEKNQLETELKLLRMQFNPHFLFNTTNAILTLINKNPRQASDSLAKFADLLRYQLYECNVQQISLTTELNYIENFVTLEKLRQGGATHVMLAVDKPHISFLTISPFIIMPFVENAFKHAAHLVKGKSWINIVARQDYEHLYLFVSNSTSPNNPSTPPSGNGQQKSNSKGIGLRNVRRLLESQYPNCHKLRITRSDNQFRVELRMRLERDEELERREEMAMYAR
jgi:LytS/YehU family sensor histidine kinase